MAEGTEWPKALYRDGGAELLWGEPIETRAANDAEEEAALIADGWRLHPLIRDEKKPARKGK